MIGHFGLYFDPTGLAAARIEVRALRVVMMPALAIETVCCSITSCSTDRVASDILSNSSIQQTPPSERTRAPLKEVRGERVRSEPVRERVKREKDGTHDSRTCCFESGSRVMYAVRPTADDPFPDVYTPRGAILLTY